MGEQGGEQGREAGREAEGVRAAMISYDIKYSTSSDTYSIHIVIVIGTYIYILKILI